MSDFRDFDPEDAYDVDDPPGRRLEVLARVVAAVTDDDDDGRLAVRRRDVLRVLSNLRDDLEDRWALDT